jgi:hypothetical protein
LTFFPHSHFPSNRQTSAAQAELVSYLEALQTDPAVLSLASIYATDTAAFSSIEAFESSIESMIAAHETPAANFLDSLPANAQPVFKSVASVELAIESNNGFSVATGAPTAIATSTKKGQAAAPTHAVRVAAAGLVGFMGVVMVL